MKKRSVGEERHRHTRPLVYKQKKEGVILMIDIIYGVIIGVVITNIYRDIKESKEND